MFLMSQLQTLKRRAEQATPAAEKSVFSRSLSRLLQSGILDRVIAAGSPMPSFELLDCRQRSVSSDSLLGNGPLVITFYRGKW